MNRPRLFRGLRIAWTVGVGVLCLLLIVLWVRSYWRLNRAQLVMPQNQVLVVASVGGTLVVGIHEMRVAVIGGKRIPQETSLDSAKVTDDESRSVARERWTSLRRGAAIAVYFPHWFAILVFAMLSALPWMPRRFSLRTLFIVTTLIALILGAIMYMVK